LSSVYKKHVFVCVNKRDDVNKKSCGDKGLLLRENLKKSILDLKLNKDVRINKSGCLGKCSLGPCMVVYPETQWHYSLDLNDIENIMSDLIKK
tara:strand:- start:212 stop:490 length:279 start_codon:yes stop_codon:yes gene_type:complete